MYSLLKITHDHIWDNTDKTYCTRRRGHQNVKDYLRDAGTDDRSILKLISDMVWGAKWPGTESGDRLLTVINLQFTQNVEIL